MGTSRPGRDASLVGPEKILRSLQRDVEVLSRERAKGDEAYSIAMLLSEYGARLWNLLKNASKFTQEGGESV
jgi:chemotaxis methyl-accepting protein methylase